MFHIDMKAYRFIALFLSIVQCINTAGMLGNAAIHYRLHRRNSRFSHNAPANLTGLQTILKQTELKYLATHREVIGNRLVRKWRKEFEEDYMLNGAGVDGNWYFNIKIGQPLQTLETELDMLNPDFYTIMTSSGEGSRFDTFKSSSHVSGDRFFHPNCRLTQDLFSLSSVQESLLDWPICQPSHSSLYTLHKSGTILGLAPHSLRHPSHLSRLDSLSLLEQLHLRGALKEQFWSITLLNSDSGILSLGGTMAREFESIKARTDLELQLMHTDHAAQNIEKQLQARMSLLGDTPDTQFKWLDVHGANGWWTGLIKGIWVNGIKILKNQPFLLDVNCPFILAPFTVYHHFYDGVSGSTTLPPPFGDFTAFPCLNPPRVVLELAGWQFPILGESTREDIIHGPAGGRFSLGRIHDIMNSSSTVTESYISSGYCAGIVVQTTMGLKDEWKSSGMSKTWILGEPFFRGMGVVFDVRGKPRMGFRTY